MFLSRLPSELKDAKEVSLLMRTPCVILALLCVLCGVFYEQVLEWFIYPALKALNVETGSGIFVGTWVSELATVLILVGVGLGVLIWLVGKLSKMVRIVPTWTCGEVQTNEQMTVPGTHFYKTVSSMGGLKQLYTGQEKGHFDLYNQGGRVGLALTGFLRWLHSGILPMYLTWVTLGLLVILFIFCKIW